MCMMWTPILTRFCISRQFSVSHIFLSLISLKCAKREVIAALEANSCVCVSYEHEWTFFELIILQNFLFELLCVCIWMDSFNNKPPLTYIFSTELSKIFFYSVYKRKKFSTRNGTITFYSSTFTPSNKFTSTTCARKLILSD